MLRSFSEFKKYYSGQESFFRIFFSPYSYTHIDTRIYTYILYFVFLYLYISVDVSNKRVTLFPTLNGDRTLSCVANNYPSILNVFCIYVYIIRINIFLNIQIYIKCYICNRKCAVDNLCRIMADCICCNKKKAAEFAARESNMQHPRFLRVTDVLISSSGRFLQPSFFSSSIFSTYFTHTHTHILINIYVAHIYKCE